jgi:UDP-N-acetylglucosamine acyltransferase
MPTVIHPTAIVEPGAQLGADCVIHPYAIVKQWATLGDRVTVHPFAVVGGDPQDLKFRSTTRSFVRIGSDTRIREGVTVNRATDEGGWTVVGANCLLMATAHIAHECVVGEDVVVANAVLLAGHVHIGDHAILGGNAMIHQFCRVGERAMLGGGARVTMDFPPFCLATERDQLIGLNLIGLKRSGAEREAIRQLKEAFRAVYGTPGNLRENAIRLLAGNAFTAREPRIFLEFFSGGTRSVVRPRRAAARPDDAEA